MTASHERPLRTAEVIAVGSELLGSTRLDTNSLFIAERLSAIGIELRSKSVVGDNRDLIADLCRQALSRVDLVVMTGGLGPTEDDITRQISARAVGRELVYHDELEADLRERFRRWGREMPEINKRQAYVIDGADVLPNPNGSAVGMLLKLDRQFLAIFPGPPREMRPMFDQFVLAVLKENAGGVIVRRRVLRVSGMGESAVDEVIAPIYKSYDDVETSILFSRVEIELHLTARSTDADQSESRLDELAGKITAALGPAVFATNGETMEEVIGKLLTERGEKLSVAESCTGGLVGMRLTEIGGSSRYFLEGAIVYANAAKIRALGVSEQTLEDHGAVSAETAKAMAAGIRDRSGSHHAISVTGIAGPDGGTEEKPVGTVFIGYAGANVTRSIKFVFPGDRELVRWRASQAALDYLRRQILKLG